MKHAFLKWMAASAVTALCLCQQAPDPWAAPDLMEPAALAKILQASPGAAPKVICVAFPVLYRAKHIARSSFAGPGSKVEGIEDLKKAVAGIDKATEIVLYCGCCPMDRCPNIRPAFKALADLGYKKVRVLNLATNTNADWSSKGYPVEAASEAAK